jgi:putative endonuclease
MLALGASTHAFCRHHIHRIARHCAYSQPMAGGWLYIMTNRPNGTLYVGVTANLARRIAEHHPEIVRAIQREKTIKHWRRAWKVRLIRSVNWDWDDLCGTI